MKYTRANVPGLVSKGPDLCYPVEILLPQYESIKRACHKYGLKFYCGENRLRALSDELCCCGIEGMGWKENKANLNHYLFDKDNFELPLKYNKSFGVATTLLFVIVPDLPKLVVALSPFI